MIKFKQESFFKDPLNLFLNLNFFLCNELPTIAANDDGTWSRLEVVEFIMTF